MMVFSLAESLALFLASVFRVQLQRSLSTLSHVTMETQPSLLIGRSWWKLWGGVDMLRWGDLLERHRPCKDDSETEEEHH